jgi:hypothetical protein
MDVAEKVERYFSFLKVTKVGEIQVKAKKLLGSFF